MKVIIGLLAVIWVVLAIFASRGKKDEWKEWFLAKFRGYPPVKTMVIEILTTIAIGWIMFQLFLK